jgi:hypothetical protein
VPLEMDKMLVTLTTREATNKLAKEHCSGDPTKKDWQQSIIKARLGHIAL